MSPTFSAYIAGEWVSARSGKTFVNVNPAATSDELGSFPFMDEEDTTAAIEAAQAAFSKWKQTTPVARGGILLKAADLLRDRLNEIARDMTREEGKTLAESRGEVNKAADTLAYYGAFGRNSLGEVLPDSRPDVLALTLREPLGVVAAITPWNVPLAIPARKLAPALVAGNTVILKPATLTPLSAIHLVQALVDAGLPPGVLNLLIGSGERIGSALARHPAVKAISFTGSTAAGHSLLREAAPHGVRLQTEMGGKNALAVLADANLEQAVKLTLSGAYALSGQQCTATSRVLVEQPVYERYLELLTEQVSTLRVGPGLDAQSQMGPLVDANQIQAVEAAIQRAQDEGARVLVGGLRLRNEHYQHGFFFAPTVLADARPEMACMQEEIFGPVVSVCAIESLDEAIAIANNTRYGLSAAICTANLAAAHRFLREVEVGAVGVNVPTVGWDVQVPFGGFKDSGSAFKEHAAEAVNFFSRIKSVAILPGF